MYALGSLAHGGFSRLVSDVDIGFVLAGPLSEADVERAGGIGKAVVDRGLPLADRLSVFWGSRQSLEGDATLGRFPAIDRTDLLLYGRLLFGSDVRAGLAPPTREELSVQGAQAGLGLLSRAAYKQALAEPGSLLRGDPKPLTKTVLFPVRFLYTLRTGDIGRNHDAVDHFTRVEQGPAAELAAAALRWRDQAPAADDPMAAGLLNAGLAPIFRLFASEHAQRMAEYGRNDLAEELRRAAASL